jgi:hypothetical protein
MEAEVLQNLAYHAEQAEISTGKGQCDYILSAVMSSTDNTVQDRKDDFSLLAASCGLTLCLRDWETANPGYIAECSTRRRLGVEFPVLTSLFFAPPDGKFYDRYLTHILLSHRQRL